MAARWRESCIDERVTCAGNNTIAALLAGGAEAVRLETHLDRCPACRELVAQLGRGLSRLGEAPVAKLPPVGARVGRYQIARVLGAGGMGVVYAAHDATLERQVAIKVLRPELHDADLLAEALAMARLQHPNIVSVFDAGVADGQHYVCMEYVDGATLRTWVRGKRWREIVEVYRAAGEGLAYVHRAGLVHLDFKPDNVLVDRDGRARVTDFGLARRLGARCQGGTPAYMPPEQRRGAADARTDQYAFCASLAEALGRRGPAWLHRALARGQDPDPAERWADMRTLLAALAPRRRRSGSVAIVGVAAAIALAVTLPSRPTSTLRIVEEPVPALVPWAMPLPVRVEVERASASAAVAVANMAHAAHAHRRDFAPAGRRDFAPAFAMLARAASRTPSVVQPRTFLASSASGFDDVALPGFTSELGLCDDGTVRTCTIEMPSCPAETIASVQAGCWTCAELETCTPLGIPQACRDGSPGCWIVIAPPTHVDPPPPPRPREPVASGSGGSGSGSGAGSGAGSGSGSGTGSGSGSGWGSGAGSGCGSAGCV